MIHVNGERDDFRSETVEALLVRRGIEPRGIAVALDGEVVHRANWARTAVPEGCTIEIVTAAAGG